MWRAFGASRCHCKSNLELPKLPCLTGSEIGGYTFRESRTKLGMENHIFWSEVRITVLRTVWHTATQKSGSVFFSNKATLFAIVTNSIVDQPIRMLHPNGPLVGYY